MPLAPRTWLTVALALSCAQREGEPCAGGLLLADGGCIAKCDPALCVENNTCVANRCTLRCTSHLDCEASQRCVAANEDGSGAQIFVCAAAELHSNGVPCPLGNECEAPASCLSAGPGDGTAYCAELCLKDADCPGGFECGAVRDPHGLCGTTKGNNAFCGSTIEECIDPAALALEPHLVEGSLCLQRRVCVKRAVCSACATDVDCSLMGGRCRQVGISNRCLAPCGRDTDCPAGDLCADGTCRPLFHDCVAPPAFCSPCRFDSDCGPSLTCAELHAGQRACLDQTYSQACVSSADCPVAASGMRGICLGAAQGVPPNHPHFNRCGAPRDINDSASCYPAQ